MPEALRFAGRRSDEEGGRPRSRLLAEGSGRCTRTDVLSADESPKHLNLAQ